MEEKIIENNRATICGEIVSDFTFSHDVFGEGFYIANLSSKRASETVDTIPIMVSERLVDVKMDWVGRKARIKGQFRSHNKRKKDKRRLILYVFALEFEEIEELPYSYDCNGILLDGYICKDPVYRETPLGREITDIMLAANRSYGKSDYIPCICWGRNARFSGNLAIGTHIKIIGRIQSREYKKRISDAEIETRTAYEVSVSKIYMIEETEDNEHEKQD